MTGSYHVHGYAYRCAVHRMPVQQLEQQKMFKFLKLDKVLDIHMPSIIEWLNESITADKFSVIVVDTRNRVSHNTSTGSLYYGGVLFADETDAVMCKLAFSEQFIN